MANRRVWIDSWQMQCCGEPFAVGSDVTWSTSPVADASWFDGFLADSEAASITDHEEHHSEETDNLHQIAGVVRSIDAVYCRYSLEGRMATPVAGSGEPHLRSSVDGWEPDDGDDDWVAPRFVGYLVNIEMP